MGVRRLLVIGWDGAEPALVDELCARGALPNLARLRRDGWSGRVRSTRPASSLPAWNTALTGLQPGRHGLVHFVRRRPGSMRLSLVDARERAVPTLLQQAGRCGLRVAGLGIPGTYPPEPHSGTCIAGFDSPFATSAAPGAYRPARLGAELGALGLGWPYGGLDEVAVGPGWHRRARPVLLGNIVRKTQVASWLMERGPYDLFWLVFSESDTAGHHFWAFCDPSSPRHRPAPALADTLEVVYRALDRALGALLAAAGPQAAVMVLSDHGFCGASDHVVHLDRWLEQQGLLRFGSIASRAARVAGWLRERGAGLVPARIKQSLMRGQLARAVMQTDGLARFGGLDRTATLAFCDELPQDPGIWINLAGREPRGRVLPGDDYERLRARIAEALSGWRDPVSGRAVVEAVWRREDVAAGPFCHRVPDLVVRLASWDGHRLLAAPSAGRPGPVLRRLSFAERVGGKGVGTSGVHAAEGILVLGGPGIDGRVPGGTVDLADVAPTAARLLGIDLRPDLDGRVLACIPGGPQGVAPGTGSASRRADRETTPRDTTPAERERIRRRLERLGYL